MKKSKRNVIVLLAACVLLLSAVALRSWLRSGKVYFRQFDLREAGDVDTLEVVKGRNICIWQPIVYGHLGNFKCYLAVIRQRPGKVPLVYALEDGRDEVARSSKDFIAAIPDSGYGTSRE